MKKEDSTKFPEISFICCVYNEVERAPCQLKLLLDELNTSNLLNRTEIFLLDNSSNDGTKQWAEEEGSKNDSVISILNNSNLGKGGSIKKALQLASGRYCIIYDLDGEYCAKDAINGISIVTEKTSLSPTLLLASRTLDGSARYIYFKNYLGVRLLSELINLLYGSRLTDAATGLKILETCFYKANKMQSNSFDTDFEIVCIALSKRKNVSEYPGWYCPRSIKEGKKLKAFSDGISSLFVIAKATHRLCSKRFVAKNIVSYILKRSALHYFIVGTLATIIDIAIFTLAYPSIIPSLVLANTIAFTAAIGTNYLLGIITVFTSGARFNKRTELLLTGAFSIFGLAINSVTLYTLISIFNLNGMAAKLIAAIPTFAWNYSTKRFFIFRPRRSKAQNSWHQNE